MPNGPFNWTFRDVSDFLKAHGFSEIGVSGGHYHFSGIIEGQHRLVQVSFHGHKSFKPRVFKSIVAQSGIPLNEWYGR